MTEQKNLSEKLFKPQFCYPETSSLIQRVSSDKGRLQSLLDGEGHANWYRVINRLSWHWRGLPLFEVDEVLARIAASNKKRTNEQWLDTVIGYQSGNWIYEFLTQAAKWRQKAEALNVVCDGENAQTDEKIRAESHAAWLTASLFSGLASYPYYRNDDLSNQAQTFVSRDYREAMNCSPYLIKDLCFTVEKKSVKAILHTPLTSKSETKAFPIVFLCAGLSHLQYDFYNYFANYLAPLGVGLLTVDSPSIGHSRQFNLSQNTSIIHQAILEQLQTVPLIDYTKVILLGERFGTNIATRLAYLAPNRIKGVINVSPMVHQLFTDNQMQANLSPIYRDIIASRLGLTSMSDQQLVAELKFFSLKEQRLLSKPCNVAVLNIHYDGDPISSLSEAKLITSTKKTSLIHIKERSLKESLENSSAKSSQWIKALIS